MIPKIIHHCWFSGDPLPSLYKRCVESWHVHLEGYEFKLWTLENTNINTPFLSECLKNRQWAFLSDYVRMRALRDHGGIYLDMDMELVKSLDPLLNNACFTGNEAPNRPNPSIIGSVREHPFLASAMELIDQRYLRKKPYLIAPEVAMTVLEDKNIAQSVTIYPSCYFYPYNPYDKTRSADQLMYSDIKEDTYAIHHWGKSWNQSLFERVIKKMGKIIQRKDG